MAGNSNKKKMDVKYKKMISAAVAAVLILVVAIAVIVNTKKDTEEDSVNISLNKTDLKETDDKKQVENVQTTVEIQFDDYAIPVGTKLQMTALVTPMDTEEGLVWSSSDTNVLEITADGILSVKQQGTAVITATVGSISDSVVIEGINDIKSGSSNNFPVYMGSDDTYISSGSDDTITGQSGSVSNSNTQSSNQGSSSSNKSSNGGPGTNISGNTNGSNNGNTSSSAPESTGGSSNDSSGGNTNNSGSNSGSNQSNGLASGQIGSSLEGMGFAHDLSNVYICKDENTYYGEIITQPNVTIIYIKQRNGEFDSKIRSVIQLLLPDSVDEVWNNYLSASTDRTFTVKGRKVRIVTAAGGGHSQIVIYN